MTHPLLTPRFEVIAGYPHSAHDVGDIIEIKPGRTAPMTVTTQYDQWEDRNTDCCNYCPVESFREFPNLFKELRWWERRSRTDLPDYVRINGTPKKVVRFSEGVQVECAHGGTATYELCESITPATLEEYTEYINSKKKDK